MILLIWKSCFTILIKKSLWLYASYDYKFMIIAEWEYEELTHQTHSLVLTLY